MRLALLAAAVSVSCAYSPAPAPQAVSIGNYTGRSVNVLRRCDRAGAPSRWVSASGLAIGPRRVLTAAHVIECVMPGWSTGALLVVGENGLGSPANALDWRRASDMVTIELAEPILASDVPTAAIVESGHTVCLEYARPRAGRSCGVARVRPGGDLDVYVGAEPGNSGGGVYTLDGRLVGVLTHWRPCPADQSRSCGGIVRTDIRDLLHGATL